MPSGAPKKKRLSTTKARKAVKKSRKASKTAKSQRRRYDDSVAPLRSPDENRIRQLESALARAKGRLSRVPRLARQHTIDYYEKKFSQQEEANQTLQAALAKAKSDVAKVREGNAISLEKRLEEPLRSESKNALLGRIADLTERIAQQGIELRNRERAITELLDQVKSMGGSIAGWARFRSNSRPVMKR